MVDLDTYLVSVALVATSINTILTTFTLLHSVNEKAKLLKTLHTVSSALIVVAKKRPIRTRLGTAGRAGLKRLSRIPRRNSKAEFQR